MAIQWPEMIPYLGLTVTGDLGPLTIYTTRRNRIVFFPKTPPDKPPSDAQIVMRGRWRLAAISWKQLSKEDRETWEAITIRAGLRITGYNFFVSLFVHPNPEVKITVERLAGENLP